MQSVAPTSPRRLSLRSLADAARFFGCGMGGGRTERVFVAHLDAGGALLGVSLGYGRAEEVAVPLRRITADALRLGTHALIVAHNHPSGDPTPSAADRRAIARLADLAETLGIALHDHLIFAGGRCRSFRALGLL